MKNFNVFLTAICCFLVFACSKTEVTRQENAELESVNAPAIPGLFKKRVLIEDYTGTWCGNCAVVSYAIERVYENPKNNSVTVAIHSGTDPFKFLDVGPLHNYIFSGRPASLPEARLNRTIKWKDQDTNLLDPINLRSNNCGLGLAIKSSIIDNNISLDIKCKFAQNYSGLKLVVYLLEDKLIYKQENYSNYYNAVNPIQGFEHNHVLRKSLTNVLGDNILDNIVEGKTIIKNFSLAVPSNISVANNIGFVAFIVDANNTVINVRGSSINENQNLEENL